MSRCLVLGGGLLGAHTAVALRAEGHEVTVFSRSFSAWLRAHHAHDGMRLVVGDLGSPPALGQLVHEAEVVFYLAGSSTPEIAAHSVVASANGSLLPALHGLDAMRAAGTRKIVLSSSGGTVYGRVERVPTPEDHPTEPISIHGLTSLALERYAYFFARLHSFEPVVLRYANVYGPGQRTRGGQGVIAAWFDALAAGIPITMIGDGSVRRDFLYAGDAAQAAVHAAFSVQGSGLFNVGAHSSVALSELLELMQEITGLRAGMHTVADRGIDVPVTQLDSSRIEGQTGWRPRTSLRDGLEASWAWMSERRQRRGPHASR